MFIYCCKGVSAGYCFLVKRIFAPAAHEKVWIFHYVKKTFYQRNFTSYICRFVKQTYGVLLQNIPVTHYWCTWAWYLSAYTSTADSDHVHLRFRYPDCNLPPHCRRKSFQKSQSSYLRLFCRGNCIFCCFLPGILLVSLQLCGFLGSTDSERVTDLQSDTDSFSEYSVEYTSYLYQQLLFGKKTGRISRRSPTSGTAFPHRRMLYSLSDLCIARAKHHSGNCSRRKSYRGNSLIFYSLFAVSMHFKVTHYNIRNIRRPLSVLRKLLHISVPLTMNKILLTLLGSIEVILIPARLQMSGFTPKIP